MTLSELSRGYETSADLIAARLHILRENYRQTTDEVEREHLHRRILDLSPLLQQCRELQRLTAHYYDRSYHCDEKYCL